MLLHILKMVSIFITACIGIYGTIFEVRDNGKITLPGKIIIIGLVLFGGLSLSIQFLSSKNEIEAARIAKEEATVAKNNLENSINRQKTLLRRTEKSSKTLEELVIRAEKDVKRLGVPLKNIYVSFTIEYDCISKRFPRYYKRQKKSIEENFKKSTKKSKYLSDLKIENFSTLTHGEGEPKSNEREAYSHFYHFLSIISFCTDDFLEDDRGLPMCDLVFKSHSWIKWDSISAKNTINSRELYIPKRGSETFVRFNFEKNTLWYNVKFSPVEIFRNKNTVFSIYDIIDPKDPKNTNITFQTSNTSPAFNPPKLLELRIHFDESGQNSIDIPSDLFIRHIKNIDSLNQRILFSCSIDKIVQWHAKNPKKDTSPYPRRPGFF